MSERATSTALGRITRIDGDFIQLESGYAFWLPSDLQGTQGIMLGDMVEIEYRHQMMMVTKIAKRKYNLTKMQVTAIRKAGKDEDMVRQG